MSEIVHKVNTRYALQVSKVYNSREAMYKSPELAEIWRSFQGLDSWKKAIEKSEFIAAYVVPMDPEKNYGRAFNLYRHFRIKGVERIKEVTASSVISLNPLQLCTYNREAMEIRVTDTYIRNCKEGYDWVRKHWFAIFN